MSRGPGAPEPRGSLRARGPGCWALNVCPKHGGHRSSHQHLPSPLSPRMADGRTEVAEAGARDHPVSFLFIYFLLW